MGKYIINGGKPLNGEMKIQGSKNSCLPIMAASLMSGKTSVLHNVPDIEDVKLMKELLVSLGCDLKSEGSDLIIDSSGAISGDVSEETAGKMRSSVMLIGALCSRCERVSFSYPGGCDIGLRPIDLHLSAFREMGAVVSEDGGYIFLDSTGMKSANIVLNYPSVGATENIILASVLQKGVTAISNAAREPEITDLQNFLNSMGARVYGAGGSNVYIEGVQSLTDCEYTVMPDRIVSGTMLCLAHMCAEKVYLRNCFLDSLKAPYYKLIESGIRLKIYSDGVLVYNPDKIGAIDKIITMPYPSFPTDLQPIFSSMLCFSDGLSVVKETVFENRYHYTTQLKRMGANIRVEGPIAIIKGIKTLQGSPVNARDLRGGAALVVAALKAEGKSIINDINHIKRGYENFAPMLKSLGAEIKEI